ncbi:MAG: hypothetical protein K9G60_07580 [Pseudolabrys sp.]|nr:hypothetical protein [Pseudolabrys sp.]
MTDHVAPKPSSQPTTASPIFHPMDSLSVMRKPKRPPTIIPRPAALGLWLDSILWAFTWHGLVQSNTKMGIDRVNIFPAAAQIDDLNRGNCRTAASARPTPSLS